MTRFVILSLAVHILAVVAIYDLQPQQAAMPTIGTLSISLHTVSDAASKHLLPPTPVTAQAGVTKPAPERRTMAQADSIMSTEPAKFPEPESQATDTTVTEAVDNGNKAGTAQARAAEADMLDSLRTAVYHALHASFNYPRRARQRGWEGTVVIALRILPDGKLANIRIAGSSGIATLDRAAIASLSEISVPQVIAWMHGRELDMTIPVEYRLTDG